MKTRVLALFLAVTMMTACTTPTAQGFEKIDRAIMNMIRNMGNRSNRGARRAQRARRARASQPAPRPVISEV